ncbi:MULTISPECIES: hypothetical protein [unclassified Paenibacillus]|uniref:hypothetical protein n=1 Tax=unclassified Paenibacillus TaxID=185978 RepID=UPI0008C05B8F|nr:MULTISPECIES: hypothetical protein [unclassified Paenibacillus]QLG40292.1 hypothetical protein HW560_20695 [Paenibacillus sp. E222]SEN76261.1 hypothetical protein SAMN05518670_2652 [Paenibacillus sp. OK076]
MTSTGSQDDLIEAYRVALDELISYDTVLNTNMEYISLVWNEGVTLKSSDKQVIEESLQKEYNVTMYNYTYEQLIEEKLYAQQKTTLRGILLTIEKQQQSNNPDEMTIEVSKYRANEGAVALDMKLACQEGQWKVVEYGMIRES